MPAARERGKEVREPLVLHRDKQRALDSRRGDHCNIAASHSHPGSADRRHVMAGRRFYGQQAVVGLSGPCTDAPFASRTPYAPIFGAILCWFCWVRIARNNCVEAGTQRA